MSVVIAYRVVVIIDDDLSATTGDGRTTKSSNALKDSCFLRLSLFLQKVVSIVHDGMTHHEITDPL